MYIKKYQKKLIIVIKISLSLFLILINNSISITIKTLETTNISQKKLLIKRIDNKINSIPKKKSIIVRVRIII